MLPVVVAEYGQAAAGEVFECRPSDPKRPHQAGIGLLAGYLVGFLFGNSQQNGKQKSLDSSRPALENGSQSLSRIIRRQFGWPEPADCGHWTEASEHEPVARAGHQWSLQPESGDPAASGLHLGSGKHAGHHFRRAHQHSNPGSR